MTLSQYNEAIQNYEKEMCCLIDTISRVAHANGLGDARYNFTAGSQAYTIQSLTHPEGEEELTIYSQNNVDDKPSQIMFLSKGKHIETFIEGEWEPSIYLLDINIIKQREKKKKDELVEKARKIGLIRISQ